MFGFGKRKPRPLPPGPHCFGVRTRIGRSVSRDLKFKGKCSDVRALPSVNGDEVVLQATDGHHAACLLTKGRMVSPRLVPPEVLPSRQLQQPVGIRLQDGQWESLEGRIVPDTQDAGGERNFPKLGDVLPVVGKTPFYETAVQAERRKATDAAPSQHVALGIDLELLRKAAESLGTMKLTLFVPVPVKDVNRKPGETFVNKPVAVCPAHREAEGQGVAVVMPLTPENGVAYYTKVREVVVASEKRALNAVMPVQPVQKPVQAVQSSARKPVLFGQCAVQKPVQAVQAPVRLAG